MVGTLAYHKCGAGLNPFIWRHNRVKLCYLCTRRNKGVVVVVIVVVVKSAAVAPRVFLRVHRFSCLHKNQFF